MPHFEKKFFIGASLFFAIVLLAALSWFWTPYNVAEIDIALRFQGSSLSHFLGTDHLGRDMLSLLMVGARHSLFVSFFSLGMGLSIGVPLGLLAVRYRGIPEEAILRVNDIIFAFPIFLSAAMIAALWGAGPVVAIFSLGIFNISVFARLTRIFAAALYVQPFILSARAMGQSEWRMIKRHILPNILGILIVQSTIQLTLAILVEASLGYLGFSAPPNEPSWGKMLYESRTFATIMPQLALYPGCMIFLLVVGVTFLGEAWRKKRDSMLKIQGRDIFVSHFSKKYKAVDFYKTA